MSTKSNERTRIEKLRIELDRHPLEPFPLHGPTINAPPTQGVYLILAPDNTVLHVGRTVSGKNGLLQRLRNHLRGQSSFVRNHLSGKCELLRGGYKFKFIVVEDDRDRALLEYHAIAWYCPMHLGLGRIGLKEDQFDN